MALKKIGLNKWRVTASVRDKNKGYPITKQRVVEGTRAEAVIAESDLLKELRARSLTIAYAITFSDAVGLYLTNLQNKGRLSARHREHAELLRRELGHIRLEAFDAHFEAYHRRLMDVPTKHGSLRKPSTINRYTGIVRAVFNLLVDKKIIDKNPLDKDRFPTFEEKARNRYLSQEERMLLLHTITIHRPYILPIVRYMLAVPCRVSELTSARREQYNPIANTVYIPDSKAGIPIYKPVPPEMTDYFRSIPLNCPWLFYREIGGEYHDLTHRFVKAWRFCVTAAGITDIRRHDLRHMAATDMLNAGTPANVVALIAGWKSTDMLTNYYHADSLMASEYVVFRRPPDNVVRFAAAV